MGRFVVSGGRAAAHYAADGADMKDDGPEIAVLPLPLPVDYLVRNDLRQILLAARLSPADRARCLARALAYLRTRSATPTSGAGPAGD